MIIFIYQSTISPFTAVAVFAPLYCPGFVPAGISIPHQVSFVVGVCVIGLGTLSSVSVGVVERETPDEYAVSDVSEYFWYVTPIGVPPEHVG